MERTWNDLTRESLREIAKEQGLRGYSKFSKEALIQFIQQELSARRWTEREIQSLLEEKPLSARSPFRDPEGFLQASGGYPVRKVSSISEPLEEEIEDYAMNLLNLPNYDILELMDRMDEDLLARVCFTHPRFYALCQRPAIQRRLTLAIPGYREALEKIQEAQTLGATELLLSYIKLPKVPSEIGNLLLLQKLFLNNNRLTSLPPEIGNLSSLQELYLNDNFLTSLPSEIENLTNLRRLYLPGNNLTSLPPEIGNLPSLRVLYLSGNDLTSLPPEIGNLSLLVGLYLHNNDLTSLPPEMRNLSSLAVLTLKLNPIDGAKDYQSHMKVQRFLSTL